MKRVLIIFSLLLSFSVLEAQTFKFLPLGYDAPDTKNGKYIKYDKIGHFTLHTALVLFNPIKKNNIDLYTSILFGVCYEVYDGFDWKRTCGFSFVDLIFDVSGAILGTFLKDLCHHWFYVLVDKNGISLQLRR